MDNLFYGCSKMTIININNFASNNLVSTTNMFRGCGQLSTITFPSNFASRVTNMDNMFYECSSLTSINFSLLKTSNVNSMNYMFYGCYQFQYFINSLTFRIRLFKEKIINNSKKFIIFLNKYL